MYASVNLIWILQHQYLIYASVNHNKNPKDHLIKESTDFTYEEVELRTFSILSISFNVLILDGYRRSSRKAVLNLSLIVSSLASDVSTERLITTCICCSRSRSDIVRRKSLELRIGGTWLHLLYCKTAFLFVCVW
jgi:hypothetical protein